MKIYAAVNQSLIGDKLEINQAEAVRLALDAMEGQRYQGIMGKRRKQLEERAMWAAPEAVETIDVTAMSDDEFEAHLAFAGNLTADDIAELRGQRETGREAATRQEDEIAGSKSEDGQAIPTVAARSAELDGGVDRENARGTDLFGNEIAQPAQQQRKPVQQDLLTATPKFGVTNTKKNLEGRTEIEKAADEADYLARQEYFTKEAQNNEDSIEKNLRDTATDSDRRESKTLLGGLRNVRRRFNTILANAIATDFEKHSGTALLGRKVESAEDLATLAQIYRDPRYETLASKPTALILP